MLTHKQFRIQFSKVQHFVTLELGYFLGNSFNGKFNNEVVLYSVQSFAYYTGQRRSLTDTHAGGCVVWWPNALVVASHFDSGSSDYKSPPIHPFLWGFLVG